MMKLAFLVLLLAVVATGCTSYKAEDFNSHCESINGKVEVKPRGSIGGGWFDFYCYDKNTNDFLGYWHGVSSDEWIFLK